MKPYILDSYAKLRTSWSIAMKARTMLRDSAIFAFSQRSSTKQTTDWIRFPYYHHVFEDERRGFSRQLDYLSGFGEFVSLDQAIDILSAGDRIDGRYFCVTFDDGIKCCYDHALPILVERGISATFFVVTDFTADTIAGEKRICKPLYHGMEYFYEYMTWQECAEMVDAGMIIGSHTCSHARLKCLETGEARRQLSDSKRVVESKLGKMCRHFACPWGQIDKDYDPRRDVDLAEEAGYESFLTTQRGKNEKGNSPFAIKRDNTYANWGNYQLRYFFAL